MSVRRLLACLSIQCGASQRKQGLSYWPSSTFCPADSFQSCCMVPLSHDCAILAEPCLCPSASPITPEPVLLHFIPQNLKSDREPSLDFNSFLKPCSTHPSAVLRHNGAVRALHIISLQRSRFKSITWRRCELGKNVARAMRQDLEASADGGSTSGITCQSKSANPFQYNTHTRFGSRVRR